GDGDGPLAAADGQAQVADAALTGAFALPPIVAGQIYSGLVATLSDANPFSDIGDFTVTITWGNGQTTGGTITRTSNHTYEVSGSVTYDSDGSPAVSVHITSTGGSSVTVTGNAQIAVLQTTEGQPWSATLGGFAAPGAVLADLSATVGWGD